MTRRLYGNYHRKVLQLVTGDVQPGRVYIVDVRHDARCSFWRTRRCDCNPTVTKREDVLQ